MYQFTADGGVSFTDGSSITFIPVGATGPYAEAYLAWLAEGNTPEPAAPEPAPEVPALTDIQLRLALLSMGITEENVDAAIATIPDAMARATARIWWERAAIIKRDHPMVAQLAAMIGLTEPQVDAAWAAAAAL